MSNEQFEQLVRYMAGLQLYSPELEQLLREKINSGLPNFSVQQIKSYGEDRMTFNLHFSIDHQFGGYRFTGMKARFDGIPKIEATVINGVNTSLLDQLFSQINWKQYYGDKDGLTGEMLIDIKNALKHLTRLIDRPSDQGLDIHQKLIFKHLPEKVWDDATQDLIDRYTFERSFTASENGMVGADLAYNIVSNKLNNINEKLAEIDLNSLEGTDVYMELEKILSGTPESFHLTVAYNRPEAYAVYDIPVKLIGEEYTFKNYTVTVTPHPEIEHGKFNGIDTKDLEERMAGINWQEQKHHTHIHDGEPMLPSEAGRIDVQMHLLSQDLAGFEVADRLALKYWAGVPFYKETIQQSAWELLGSMPGRKQTFSSEINARTAYNLLNGRAASRPKDQNTASRDHWMRLDLEGKAETNYHVLYTIKGFPETELERLLNVIPISNMDFYPYKYRLMQGDTVTAKLNDGKQILMQANPEQKSIDLFTTDYRPIPVNLRFDPDWKPPLAADQQSQKSRQRNAENTKGRRPSNNAHKRKGRGL